MSDQDEDYVYDEASGEWISAAEARDRGGASSVEVRDSVGNLLADGDSVTLIKDLKVKGSSITLKQGTKIKGIRIVDGDHEVDCKTDAGQMLLKACYLRKA